MKVFNKAVRFAPFGLSVVLSAGIDGLIHTPELSGCMGRDGRCPTA